MAKLRLVKVGAQVLSRAAHAASAFTPRSAVGAGRGAGA